MNRSLQRTSGRAETTWSRRRIVCAVLGGAVVAVGAPITCSTLRSRRAERLHAQWMEYEPPPDLVVYEEEPDAAARLLATGDGGYFILPGSEDKPPLTTQTPVAHFPPNARTLQKLVPGGCAFLHWLRHGDEEVLILVSLQLAPGDPTRRTTRAVTLTPFKVSGLGGNDAKPPPACGLPFVFPLSITDTLRVFAGQRDVGDTSHFTVSFTRTGRRGTLHGLLEADGTVSLSLSRTHSPS